jgi:hypothetical protein
LLAAHARHAALDEDALGKAAGYPVGGNLKQAHAEAYRVGSFSAMDSIVPSCSLAPADEPAHLPRAPVEPRFNDAGAQTQVSGLVLPAATGRTLCACVEAKNVATMPSRGLLPPAAKWDFRWIAAGAASCVMAFSAGRRAPGSGPC